MNSEILLSLGSNLGPRAENIREALRKLEESGVRIISVSSLYETEPVGAPGQPDYINAVCRAETELPPLSLLELCQAIERGAGRTRKGDGSPRCIDIDILVHGEAEMDGPGLTLPHPGMYRRRFVLVPLREILPGFRQPGSGKDIDRLIEECGDPSWVRIKA